MIAGMRGAASFGAFLSESPAHKSPLTVLRRLRIRLSAAAA
jgi:hypothetical protein